MKIFKIPIKKENYNLFKSAKKMNNIIAYIYNTIMGQTLPLDFY